MKHKEANSRDTEELSVNTTQLDYQTNMRNKEIKIPRFQPPTTVGKIMVTAKNVRKATACGFLGRKKMS